MSLARDTQWLLKEKYHGVPTANYAADVARLTAGEPLAYVIGHIPFLTTTIWLDSHPLIPRPETEYWVDICHKTVRDRASAPLRILDLCAGSGAIGVATLAALPNCTVDFVELDTCHESTIRKNLAENHIAPHRYRLLWGDLYAPLSPTDRYDFILSNPPYIDHSLNRTDASVTDHEPTIALFSDQGGLAHITEIIAQAPQHLNPHGELWLEHEPEHVAAILHSGRDRFVVHTHPDQYGVKRFSRLVLQ